MSNNIFNESKNPGIPIFWPGLVVRRPHFPTFHLEGRCGQF